MQLIRVSWREHWSCAHDFELAEAIAFVNERLTPESQLPADASPGEVADAMDGLNLEDDLAEIDIADRTEMSLVRFIDRVEVC